MATYNTQVLWNVFMSSEFNRLVEELEKDKDFEGAEEAHELRLRTAKLCLGSKPD